jgi:site-specific DNA-methyltransferase (adenine-specific)
LRPVHNLDRNHNNVWDFKRDKGENYHSCQKPIDILGRLIQVHSKKGATVLDCFMGSGSTGVACLQTNRNFIGIELDEKYYNIAKKRCSNYQSKLM